MGATVHEFLRELQRPVQVAGLSIEYGEDALQHTVQDPHIPLQASCMYVSRNDEPYVPAQPRIPARIRCPLYKFEESGASHPLLRCGVRVASPNPRQTGEEESSVATPSTFREYPYLSQTRVH